VLDSRTSLALFYNKTIATANTAPIAPHPKLPQSFVSHSCKWTFAEVDESYGNVANRLWLGT
jgi:hypothetical protein